MNSIRSKKNILERKKRSLIRIGILAAVLVVFCLASFLSSDRTAPVFDFADADSVYELDSAGNIETQMLLSGISATDGVDGDLTDSIVIKSLRKNDDASITVVYSVRDHSGNVASESRVYNVIEVSDKDVAADSSSPEETSPQDSEQAPDEFSTSSSDNEISSSDEASSSEDIIVPEETEAPEYPSDSEESASSQDVTEASAKSEKPYIILNTSEAHVPVGSWFNYPSYIAEMWDDVDDQKYLYESIWIENYELVDWSQPGVYTLIFRIVDSDKNISDGQVLTLYVE